MFKPALMTLLSYSKNFEEFPNGGKIGCDVVAAERAREARRARDRGSRGGRGGPRPSGLPVRSAPATAVTLFEDGE